MRSIYSDLISNVYGNLYSRNFCSQLFSDIVEQVRSRILKYFNIFCEKYIVIFIVGVIVVLKLLVESFDWQVVFSKDSFYRSRFCYFYENYILVVGIRERVVLSGV